ncbi:hypothetical protein AAC387_Pa04g2286 [Persea americana]
MGFSRPLVGCFLLLTVTIGANAQPIVPALIVFGDSMNDVGNNKKLVTIANFTIGGVTSFFPYGRDFANHTPTGRFCNGKIAPDFTSENIGFTSYPPAYLSPEAEGERLLTGANFASAASCYYAETATIYHVISLSKQLEYYKEYQSKVVSIAGKENASSIFSGAFYMLSAGIADFVLNYYINPLLNIHYTQDQFSEILVYNFATELYNLGARKVWVMSLPPLWVLACFNHLVRIWQQQGCRSSSLASPSSSSTSTLISFDIIQEPSDYGFLETRKACCGTGLIETAILCNAKSPGTRTDASVYVFWDSLHPTEAANKLLFDKLLMEGIQMYNLSPLLTENRLVGSKCTK